MADPASILGLISASLTIAIRAATIGKDIHSLTTKYKVTNTKVRQLSVHIAAVRVAARSLSSWLEEDAVGSDEVEDVKNELSQVLSACCSLLSDLQDFVAKALAGAETVGFKGAVAYIWDEEIIKESMETLHYQETALVLILQALGKLTKREQRAQLYRLAVVETLAQAKRPSSSIFGVGGENRSSVRFSYTSETDARISAIFTFDLEVMASTAYRNAFTALLKRNITSKDGDRNSSITMTEVNASFDPRKTAIDDTSMVTSMERIKEPDNKPVIVEKELPSIPATTPKNEVKVQFIKGQLYCRALYDYNDHENYTELIIKKGDVIHIITQLESGWWEGVLRDVRGWFPSNYCEIITQDVSTSDTEHDFDEEQSSNEDEYENMGKMMSIHDPYLERWSRIQTGSGRVMRQSGHDTDDKT